jgi:hypothetical protein
LLVNAARVDRQDSADSWSGVQPTEFQRAAILPFGPNILLVQHLARECSA